MILRARVIIICLASLWLAGCDGDFSDVIDQEVSSETVEQERSWVLYSSPERMQKFVCTFDEYAYGGTANDGVVLQSLGKQVRASYCTDSSTNDSWEDCSTPTFRCATNYSDLFVVPRDSIAIGSTYFFHGAEFEVVTCSGDTDCSIALIIKDCANADQSICFYAGRSELFAYSRKSGVLSYAILDDTDCLLGPDRYVGKMYWQGVLLLDYGLLDDRLRLPPGRLPKVDRYSALAQSKTRLPLSERFAEKVKTAHQITKSCPAISQ